MCIRDSRKNIDRTVVTDIVNAPWCRTARRIWRLCRPIGIAPGGPIDQPYHRLHDVIDIGEIAPHVSVVEQLDRLAGADRGGEYPHRHIGPSPRTIDREKAQAL